MLVRLAVVLALVMLTAAPAQAGYWSGFQEFWLGAVKKQNGIVLLTIGFGAVCIFILTRSKAKK